MKVPATQEEHDRLSREIQRWRPGDKWDYPPRLKDGEPYQLVLPPHAMDIYAALKLKAHDLEAATKHAAEQDDSRTGVFLYFDREAVEAGLRARWEIESIDAAWLMVQDEVARPVLENFIGRRAGSVTHDRLQQILKDRRLPSIGDCIGWLAEELVPDTKPPHPEAWLPDPCAKLRGYWRTALANDLKDYSKALRLRDRLEAPIDATSHGLESADDEPPSGLERYGMYDVGIDEYEVRQTLAALGDHLEYLKFEASPETLGIAESTFHDRRNRAMGALRDIWPEAAESIPIRRNLDPDPE